MPSGAFLPMTSQSPVYLGNYEANFPNPIKTLTTANTIFNDYTYLQYPDPTKIIHGDAGNISIYQSWLDGPYKNVGYEKISIGTLLQEWDWMYDAFN